VSIFGAFYLDTFEGIDSERMDRTRKGRKTSNDDWKSPIDPDAHVTKMKDGRTHMGHKQEHAVDMETGAVVAITLSGGTTGDTTTFGETVEKAAKTLCEVSANVSKRARKRMATAITAFSFATPRYPGCERLPRRKQLKRSPMSHRSLRVRSRLPTSPGRKSSCDSTEKWVKV
jgi:hypothetical protein